MSFSWFRISGLLLIATSYSIGPIFAVPGETTMFCDRIAVLISSGDRPRA
jgi:hypothetical protein